MILKILIKCRLHPLVIFFLWPATGVNSQPAVIDEMSYIKTERDLYGYYYKNMANQYKMRYFTKYAPKFLRDFGYTEAPVWFHDVVKQGLKSNYDTRVQEAIEAAGIFKMTELADKIVALFRETPSRFTGFMFQIRDCAVGSLTRMGGDVAKKSIQELIITYPKYLIMNPEMQTLLKATAQYGDTSCVEALDRLKTKAKDDLEKVKIQPDNEHKKEHEERIQGLISSIENTRNMVMNKNGGDK